MLLCATTIARHDCFGTQCVAPAAVLFDDIMLRRVRVVYRVPHEGIAISSEIIKVPIGDQNLFICIGEKDFKYSCLIKSR